MARPRRLYTDDKGRFYYIINKKKVFVKVPKGATQKQVQKVNVKTIINLPEKKRIKRRKKKIQPKFERPLTQSLGAFLSKQTDGGLPYYIFKEKKEFPTLEELSKGKKTEPLKLEYVKTPPLALPEPEKPKVVMGQLIGEVVTPVFSSSLFDSPVVSPVKTKTPQGSIKGDVRNMSVDAIMNIFYNQGEILSLAEVQKTTSKKNVPSDRYDEAVRRYKEDMYGEGKLGSDGDDDGLYNDEIQKIMKTRVKDFVPVIPADRTDDLLKYVKRGDKRFSAIINTSDSSSDGTGKNGNDLGHWYSIFINNEDDYKTIEVFDPLVSEKIDDRLYNSLKKIARKMNPEIYFKFKQNMIRRQKLNKSTCGYHAMKFIEDRINNVPFSQASGYDEFIEKQKVILDGSKEGEAEIEKYKNKFESYI